MATSRTIAFRDYQQNKEKYEKVGEQKRFISYQQTCLESIIEDWAIHRKTVEKLSKDTVRGSRRKIRQLLRELGIDLKINLQDLLDCYENTEGLKNHIKEYQKFLLHTLKDKSIPIDQKLNYNGIASLFTPVNPFFEKYLGLDIHTPALGKKKTYATRTTLSQINKILEAINNKWHLKILLCNTEKKKEEFRKRWALERITLCSLKYLWARGIELTEGRLTIEDIKIMKKTGRLPLHNRKRINNPMPYQQPVVVDDFVKEFENYEKFRDSNDWSDEAPAIVQVNKEGKAITRKWIGRFIRGYRRELDLGDHITPHNIRKSMHTLCRSVVTNRMVAQIQLGDVSTRIADEHYNIPDKEIIKHELEKVYSCESLPGEIKTPMELSKKLEGDPAYG